MLIAFRYVTRSASVAVAALLAFACPAATVSLIPSADTSLIEAAPTNSNGGEAWVLAGTTQNGPRTRALFRFDFTSLPTNAVVRSATLVLEVTKLPSDGYASNFFGLRRMLRPWGELNQIATNNNGGLGAPALPGAATWLHSFYPSNAWAAPGGLEGVDFAGFESSSQFIEVKGSYTFDSTSDMVADVQGWVRAPGTNYGWMLLCSAEELRFTARRFASREDPSSPPQLAVDYVVPPRIDSAERTGNQFRFSFLALPEQSYAVEYRTSLSTGNWVTVTNIPAPVSATPMTITDTNAGPQRFYRLLTN